jgi:predicted phosphodiesterase
MNKIKGIFLSDLHMPENIPLKPIYKYIEDLQPDIIILGGDIIDGKNMYMVDTMPASAFKMEWYQRDIKLLDEFIAMLYSIIKKNTNLIYLAGNHENRYDKLEERYPDAFKGRFKFKEVVKNYFPSSKWIDYNTYKSYYKLGDCVFMHGRIYPENHAKKYAQILTPYKVIYGHLHSFQVFTIHNALPTMSARYAVTAGCLSKLSPEWKKGSPHMWQLGFVDFISINGITTPTPHVLDIKGRFQIGGKLYE